MSFFSKNKYEIFAKCDNCQKDLNLKIEKGKTVGEAIADINLICDYCGCNIDIEEYNTKWSLKNGK